MKRVLLFCHTSETNKLKVTKITLNDNKFKFVRILIHHKLLTLIYNAISNNNQTILEFENNFY